MSYNLLRGGIDPHGSRLTQISKLVDGLRPDFLALQEANHFAPDEADRLAELSASLGMPHTALARAPRYADGQCYHVASLSRMPIIERRDFPAGVFQSAALVTIIDSPYGSLGITNVHLHDESEDVRLAELEQILTVSQRMEPWVFIGDFNAISRADDYDESRLQCERRYEVTDRLGQSCIDVFADSAESTHPSAIRVDPRFTRPRRIDYCFMTTRLAKQVRHRQVINNVLANISSDHFPLVIDLEDPPGSLPG